MKLGLLIFCSFLTLQSWSQTTETKDSLAKPLPPDTSLFHTKFRKGFSLKWNMQPHSPLRATIYSALLPSAGQIYNHKYWKAPIVYAGVGICVYFIRDNNKNYQFYKSQYIAEADNDPNTNPTVFPVRGNNFYMEYYHKLRDISFLSLAGVYILQMIDANVDAHLFYYDVGNDLGLQIAPAIIHTNSLYAAIGLKLSFH